MPAKAAASMMIRTVESRAVVEEKMRRAVGNRATMEIVQASDPTVLHVVDGFATTVVSFGSDAPHLGNTGRRLLIGPGSILDAPLRAKNHSARCLKAWPFETRSETPVMKIAPAGCGKMGRGSDDRSATGRDHRSRLRGWKRRAPNRSTMSICASFSRARRVLSIFTQRSSPTRHRRGRQAGISICRS